MSNLITSVKGVKDFISADASAARILENIFVDVSKKYGYKEMRTPIFEYTELFARGVGEFTDIVEKEMFTMHDSKGVKFSLRPENTAGVVRAYIEHGLFNEAGIGKFFYCGPMFRHEKPQAGRFRQFHQFGCEVFGVDSVLLDAEVIIYALEFLKKIGIPSDLTELNLSSVGCGECRTAYNTEIQRYLKANISQLCDNCVRRIEKNPLRVLDCKEEKCRPLIEAAPKIAENLCVQCGANLNDLKKCLDDFGVGYVFNTRLVRGLDYYTKTVFEITCSALGAQNTILAGGRYNKLVKQLGGPETPAVGWAAGLERLMIILEQYKTKTADNKIDFFIVSEQTTASTAFKLLNEMYTAGFKCAMDYESKSFKSQFRLANRLGSKFVFILGGNELAAGKIKVKNFADSSENAIQLSEVVKTAGNLVIS